MQDQRTRKRMSVLTVVGRLSSLERAAVIGICLLYGAAAVLGYGLLG